MKTNYCISEIKLSKIKELKDSWSKFDYENLLNLFEFDDIVTLSVNDMHEMLVMAIQDRGFIQSAKALLEYRLGKFLDDGDIQHTAEEFLQAELWDEHADLTLHKELFNVGVILHDAFSNRMTEPVCACIKFKITPCNSDALKDLKKGDKPSLLLRIVADGLESNSKLSRLYEDQIIKDSFPEASSIIWEYDINHLKDNKTETAYAELYLSYEWVKDFPLNERYDSVAFADKT